MNIFSMLKKFAVTLFCVFVVIYMPAFALSISLSSSIIDFGSMNPGDFKEIPIAGFYNRVSVISDQNNVWFLKISVTSPLTNTALPSVTIPNSSFNWMSTYAGSQNAPFNNLSAGLNHQPSGGYINFSLVDELVYTAINGSDYLNTPNGTEVQFKYAIGLPSSQTAGDYTTTVVYTVTQ